MEIIQAISSVFAFRNIPTTTLVVLIYITAFTSVLVTDQVPNAPKQQLGVNLTEAYSDLHEIAARPHPYNSHANDLVHSYILSRLTSATAGYPYVHIVDDLVSNGSWSSPGYGVYFEGTNILVKIDGSDPEYLNQGGVLFSAHYDSVSTAPGATDDGMGVATLIQMVQYFAANRPKRTAVFNINNGEEDWLNGAYAFLKHPWSNITDVFLNLEGASSGGRPILFRATSTAPVRSFVNKGVPHPHGNVLSADAFARGLIRSGTDYSVYTAGGMEGMDFAFYKGRSKYHTKYDSIPHTIGEEGALWAMLESVRGAGIALVSDDRTHAPTGEVSAPVYFDLFGATFIVFTLNTLFIIDIILLVIGPIVLVVLVIGDSVLQHNRRQIQNGNVHSHETFSEGIRRRFTDLGWLNGFWRWAKFWLAVVFTTGLQAVLVLGYVKLNPFIVYSSPYLVALSTFTLAYLSFVLTLDLPIAGTHGFLVPEQQKHTVLIHTYILTWAFLLLATVAAGSIEIGGAYWVTAWNAVVLLACAISCVEGMFGAEGTQTGAETAPARRFVRGVRFEQPLEQGRASDENGVPHEEVVETEPTEITPLIAQRQRSVSPVVGKEDGGAIGWWIAQLLIVVPLPLILVAHIIILLLAALPQTLADGSSAVTVYGAVSLLTVLLVIPLAPFSFKLHRFLTYFILLLFVTSTAYAWIVFPFSQEAPLKVFFQQKLTLDLSAAPGSNHQVVAALTSLSGAPGYLDNLLVPRLPSSLGTEVSCVDAIDKRGLITCTWESVLIPAPGSANASAESQEDGDVWSGRWIEVDTARLGQHAARISIQGRNSRACRVYFDNVHVAQYRVHDGWNGEGEYYAPDGGVREVRLWSRTWDQRFVVDVEWDETAGSVAGLKGRVGCGWVEYESGSVGVGSGGKIPALEEVLKFLPRWAVVSKTTDGLVEAWAPFEV